MHAPSSHPWSHVPSEELRLDDEEPVEAALNNSLSTWFRETLQISVSAITRRTGGGGGFKSTIYFAVADGEEFAIRVPHRGTGWGARVIGSCRDYHSIASTYAVHQLISHGQPVPRLIAVERDPGVFGAPFAVWERVRGLHMADYSEHWTKWPYPEEQWGEFLHSCHDIEPLSGAGPITDEGTGLCASWFEYVNRLSLGYIKEYEHHLPVGFAAQWSDLLAQYSPALDSRPVRLLHLESNGDCNLVLDSDTHTIVAVVDFEEITGGDPLFEIVYMAWHLGKRGIADPGVNSCFSWPRFLQQYGSVDWSNPLVPLYRAIILLEKLWGENRRSRIRRLCSTVRCLSAGSVPPWVPPCQGGR